VIEIEEIVEIEVLEDLAVEDLPITLGPPPPGASW
jgi:hypothetical protein